MKNNKQTNLLLNPIDKYLQINIVPVTYNSWLYFVNNNLFNLHINEKKKMDVGINMSS